MKDLLPRRIVAASRKRYVCVHIMSHNVVLILHGQCINYKCNWTLLLTPAYAYNDAKRLLQRVITRRTTPSAWPRHLTPEGASLRLAAAVAPALPPSTPIECANQSCITKGTKIRTTGNRDCVDRMCKKCCINASRAAAEKKTKIRAYCRTHKTPGYEGEPASDIPSVGPVSPPRIGPIAPVSPRRIVPVAPPSALETNTAALITLQAVLKAAMQNPPRTPQRLPAAPNPEPAFPPAPLPALFPVSFSAEPPTHIAAPAPVPAAIIPPAPSVIPVTAASASSVPSSSAASPSKGRARKPLAMPMTDMWQHNYHDAVGKEEVGKTAKTASEELARKAKVSVMFVVWLQVRTPYHFVPTCADIISDGNPTASLGGTRTYVSARPSVHGPWSLCSVQAF